MSSLGRQHVTLVCVLPAVKLEWRSSSGLKREDWPGGRLYKVPKTVLCMYMHASNCMCIYIDIYVEAAYYYSVQLGSPPRPFTASFRDSSLHPESL